MLKGEKQGEENRTELSLKSLLLHEPITRQTEAEPSHENFIEVSQILLKP
jgi:hypothetical protein